MAVTHAYPTGTQDMYMEGGNALRLRLAALSGNFKIIYHVDVAESCIRAYHVNVHLFVVKTLYFTGSRCPRRHERIISYVMHRLDPSISISNRDG